MTELPPDPNDEAAIAAIDRVFEERPAADDGEWCMRMIAGAVLTAAWQVEQRELCEEDDYLETVIVALEYLGIDRDGFEKAVADVLACRDAAAAAG